MECPICGCENTLFVSYLYQFSHKHKINKNGQISHKYTKDFEGPMEIAILCCENGCDVNEMLDWDISEDNKLIIRK